LITGAPPLCVHLPRNQAFITTRMVIMAKGCKRERKKRRAAQAIEPSLALRLFLFHGTGLSI